MQTRVACSLCWCLLLLGFFLGWPGKQAREAGSYLSGTWSDACPCRIPCPCWGQHRSSARLCVNFHTFRIEDGRFHGVSLRGAVFVLLNLPQGPYEEPVAGTLFVSKGDEDRATVIENALGDVFGLAPDSVSLNSIEYLESGTTVVVKIPGLLSYRVSFPRGKELSPEVSKGLYPWLFDARQGVVETVVYAPQKAETVAYSGTNALWGRFRIPVPAIQ